MSQADSLPLMPDEIYRLINKLEATAMRCVVDTTPDAGNDHKKTRDALNLAIRRALAGAGQPQDVDTIIRKRKQLLPWQRDRIFASLDEVAAMLTPSQALRLNAIRSEVEALFLRQPQSMSSPANPGALAALDRLITAASQAGEWAEDSGLLTMAVKNDSRVVRGMLVRAALAGQQAAPQHTPEALRALANEVRCLRHFVDTYTAREEYDVAEAGIVMALLGQPTTNSQEVSTPLVVEEGTP